MKKNYYVAYGSNLNVNQMEHRCPDAEIVGVSYIEDYELLFKGSETGSYLTIEKCKGSRVPVGVWEVSEQDERNLDLYEGFPTFYYKKELTLDVEISDDKVERLDCFVYIMHEDRPLGLPTQEYAMTCFYGYMLFDFDPEYLIRAARRSKGEE